MTHVNCSIRPSMDTDHALFIEKMKTELDFWRKEAETLRREFDNVYDHAKATGHVEIWRRDEKLDLYVKVPKAEK